MLVTHAKVANFVLNLATILFTEPTEVCKETTQSQATCCYCKFINPTFGLPRRGNLLVLTTTNFYKELRSVRGIFNVLWFRKGQGRDSLSNKESKVRAYTRGDAPCATFYTYLWSAQGNQTNILRDGDGTGSTCPLKVMVRFLNLFADPYLLYPFLCASISLLYPFLPCAEQGTCRPKVRQEVWDWYALLLCT